MRKIFPQMTQMKTRFPPVFSVFSVDDSSFFLIRVYLCSSVVHLLFLFYPQITADFRRWDHDSSLLSVHSVLSVDDSFFFIRVYLCSSVVHLLFLFYPQITADEDSILPQPLSESGFSGFLDYQNFSVVISAISATSATSIMPLSCSSYNPGYPDSDYSIVLSLAQIRKPKYRRDEHHHLSWRMMEERKEMVRSSRTMTMVESTSVFSFSPVHRLPNYAKHYIIRNIHIFAYLFLKICVNLRESADKYSSFSASRLFRYLLWTVPPFLFSANGKKNNSTDQYSLHAAFFVLSFL